MGFKLEELSKGEKIIIISGIVALLTLFLPWRDFGLLGDVKGISDYAWLPFILGWGLSLYMVFQKKMIKATFCLGGTVAAFLWSILYILSATVENPFTDETIYNASWGVLIFSFATIAQFIGLILEYKIKNVAEITKVIKEDVASCKQK